jgi:hypothetical protein
MRGIAGRCLAANAIAVVAQPPARAAGDDDDDDGVMITDRPDFSESSEVVGKGRFQIETGGQAEKSHADGPHTTTYNTPTLLRFGISKAWELRVESDGFSRLRSDDGTRTNGFADTSLGAKWHMQDGDDDDYKPSIAWLADAEFDWGSPAFRGSGVRPSLRMVAEWELPNGYSVGVMPGIVWDRNADGKRFVSGLLALAGEKDWSDKFHTFLEFAAQQVASSANGGSVLTLDFGGSYLVTKTFQVDASVYRGLNNNSPDWVFAAGISVKF